MSCFGRYLSRQSLQLSHLKEDSRRSRYPHRKYEHFFMLRTPKETKRTISRQQVSTGPLLSCDMIILLSSCPLNVTLRVRGKYRCRCADGHLREGDNCNVEFGKLGRHREDARCTNVGWYPVHMAVSGRRLRVGYIGGRDGEPEPDEIVRSLLAKAERGTFSRT